MKKITLLRTMLLGVVLTLGTMWASAQSSVTYTYTAAAGDITANGEVVLAGEKWNVLVDPAEFYVNFNTTKGIQIGSGRAPVKTIALSTSAFTTKISKVVVNASGASGTRAKLAVSVAGTAYIAATVDTLITTPADLEFTGDATGELKIDFTHNSTKGAIYVKSIAVTYEVSANFVAEPVFSLASGAEDYKPFEVTLSSATAGAKLYYTVDGTEPDATKTEYTNAITVDKDMTIKAIAINGENKSAVSTASYVVYTPAEHKDIAAFLAAKDKNRVSKIAGEVVITFVNGHDCFVQDASGAIQLRKDYNDAFDAKMVAGAKLTGVLGKYSEFNGNAQMAYEAAVVPTIVEGQPVEPTEVKIETIKLPEDLSKYIVLKGVTLKTAVDFNDKKATNITVATADTSITVRNNFKLVVDGTQFAVGDVVDVVGLVSSYKGVAQINFVSMSKEIKNAVDEVVFAANVYSANGQLVIEAEEGSEIEVYSMLGQRVAAFRAVSNVSVVDVERGVVIVRVNGAARKVVVK